MGAVSVGFVLPAFNAEAYLGAALASVLQQGCDDWAAVVVDDGSTDATAQVAGEVAARCPQVSVVRQVNAGVSAARNRGLDELAGSGLRWVCFLDSDDTLLPGSAAALAAAAESLPGAVGAYGVAEYMDSAGEPMEIGAHSAFQRRRLSFRPAAGAGAAARLTAGLAGRPLSAAEPTCFDTLAIYGSVWPPAIAIVSLDAAVASGGFDSSLTYMEDWDFFLRVARYGPLAFVDRQVAWYRRHAGNTGAELAASGLAIGERGRSYGRTVAAVRYKAWASPANTAEQRSALRRAFVREQAGALRAHVRNCAEQVGKGRWREAVSEAARAAGALGRLVVLHPVRPATARAERAGSVPEAPPPSRRRRELRE